MTSDLSGKACGYCSKIHPPVKRNCPTTRARCDKCKKIGHFSIVCRSAHAAQANQVDVNSANTSPPPPESSVHSPTFVGVVSTEGHPSHTTEVNLIGPGIQSIDPGWHIKLTVRNSPLTWCIDTGAQISVMPETVYQPTFGNLVKPDRKLVGPLDTTGYADMELCHATKQLWLGRSATAETARWQNVPRRIHEQVHDKNRMPVCPNRKGSPSYDLGTRALGRSVSGNDLQGRN